MKKYDKHDQRLLAMWAVDCVERVLPLFEQAYPHDDRPRNALDVCRTWIRTGIFKMADIRAASLAAHAAARTAKENNAACFAARGAGQALATAHVPQHAFGGAYYALKAIAAAAPAHAKGAVATEHDWQAQHTPTHPTRAFLNDDSLQERTRGMFVTVHKDADF
jgi:hypothetical protein